MTLKTYGRCKTSERKILKMIITAENRNIIKENEINIHDACFYSF